jgi:mono/diheme cytochrome c family protein
MRSLMNRTLHAAIFALALVAPAAPALAQAAFDPAVVERGMRLYKSDAADCEFCHGWQGAGRQHNTNFSDTVAHGPSLVDSKLTREQMIVVISCGKRGNGLMPRYRGDAWTPAYRCDGKVAADVTEAPLPLYGQKQLTPADIEAVVTYIQAVYQGSGGIRVADCLKYWGTANRICDLIPPR